MAFLTDHPPSNEGIPLVSMNQVFKSYCEGNVTALSGIDLAIDTQEWVSVTGKSGCGKSTLLNMIGGLDRPDSGLVTFEGRPLDERANMDRHRARNVGFVFQNYYLLPNLTAVENVQIPMFESTLDLADRKERASELLQLVGLGDREKHRPDQLSSGQRQRVAIARSLANQPSLLLADEPTGALDSENGAEIIDLLRQLHSEQSLTLVIVTHDPGIASLAGRQIKMSDGKIVADGSGTRDELDSARSNRIGNDS